MVRLGAGGLDGRSLTPTAMAAALQTLAKFKRLADSHKVDEIVAAATSATREADNGGDFIAEVDRETGIRIRVISGTEEARLIHLAAGLRRRRRRHRRRWSSTSAAAASRSRSEPRRSSRSAGASRSGVIRLTERFVKTDPLAEHDERRLVKHRQPRDGQLPRSGRGARVRPASSARRARSSAWARWRVARRERSRAGGPAQPARVRQSAPRGSASGSSKRTSRSACACPGMDPRRADLSVAGSVLFDTIVRRLGADEFTLCDLALREGLVLDYIHRNSARIRKVERYPDVRRRSVVELGERCGYWPEHAQQVARLALTIFDQTRSVHGLDRPRARVARVRRAAARRRRAHQLRAPPPAFVLPDQERRPARLRPAGDRGHRADRALSPAGDAEEIARRLRRSRRRSAAGPSRRCRRWCGWPRGWTAATRRRSPASTSTRAATTTSRGCAPPATPSSSCGPRTGTSRRSKRCSASRFGSRSPAATTRNDRHMLNKLTTPHEYPGKLFVVEGIDGSGKTTQLALLAKWLKRGRTSRLHDGMELVGARQGGDQDRQEDRTR